MRPLAFEFAEKPKSVELDFSLIEYNEQLNLSINKQTRQPAIDVLNLETETFTKTQGEASDSDHNGISNFMGTETSTFTSTEQSDSDRDKLSLLALMDTTTLTESTEATDQDKDWK